MFNKKKKKWFGNKPHYKKSPGDSNDKDMDNKPGDGENRFRPDFTAAPATKPENQEGPQDDFEPPVESILSAPVKTAAADPQNPQSPEGPVPLVPNCPICNMPIRSHYTAVRHQKTDELAHFDCVLRELSKENYSKLGRFRKIYYIGAGNFAIVKEFYDKRGHFKSYEVVERITYEAKEK